MLVESGIRLVKLWLDITKEKQRRRLDARREDPLKVSDMDAIAQEKWSEYSAARDKMLLRTHAPLTPWHVVRADRKKPARIAIMRHVLQQVAPPELLRDVERPNPDLLFPFATKAIGDGRLAE